MPMSLFSRSSWILPSSKSSTSLTKQGTSINLAIYQPKQKYLAHISWIILRILEHFFVQRFSSEACIFKLLEVASVFKSYTIYEWPLMSLMTHKSGTCSRRTPFIYLLRRFGVDVSSWKSGWFLPVSLFLHGRPNSQSAVDEAIHPSVRPTNNKPTNQSINWSINQSIIRSGLVRSFGQ